MSENNDDQLQQLILSSIINPINNDEEANRQLEQMKIEEAVLLEFFKNEKEKREKGQIEERKAIIEQENLPIDTEQVNKYFNNINFNHIEEDEENDYIFDQHLIERRSEGRSRSGQGKNMLPGRQSVPRGQESRGLITEVPLPFNNPKYWRRAVGGGNKVRNFGELIEFLQQTSGHRDGNYGNLRKAIGIYGKDRFFRTLLPVMIRCLESSAKHFQNTRLHFLPQNREGSITINRTQCAILLVNGFFSTFRFYDRIRGRGKKNNLELPTFNFRKLFNRKHEPVLVQKILCFLHYFEVIFRRPRKTLRNSFVTFERKCFPAIRGYFSSCQKKMSPVILRDRKRIEECADALQVNSGNCLLGGGVLGHGAVQEENRFCVNPECVVGMLFCPSLFDAEAIVIRGTEQFSKFGSGGRGGGFSFGGGHDDTIYKNYEICAIDAYNFGRKVNLQYQKKYLRREIWKAFVGFQGTELPEVASGHWGCGEFGVNKGLKFLVQWIAASAAEKRLRYCCHKDVDWFLKFISFATKVENGGYSVSQVHEALMGLSRRKNAHRLEKSCLEMVLEVLERMKSGVRKGRNNQRRGRREKKPEVKGRGQNISLQRTGAPFPVLVGHFGASEMIRSFGWLRNPISKIDEIGAGLERLCREKDFPLQLKQDLSKFLRSHKNLKEKILQYTDEIRKHLRRLIEAFRIDGNVLSLMMGCDTIDFTFLDDVVDELGDLQTSVELLITETRVQISRIETENAEERKSRENDFLSLMKRWVSGLVLSANEIISAGFMCAAVICPLAAPILIPLATGIRRSGVRLEGYLLKSTIKTISDSWVRTKKLPDDLRKYYDQLAECIRFGLDSAEMIVHVHEIKNRSSGGTMVGQLELLRKTLGELESVCKGFC